MPNTSGSARKNNNETATTSSSQRTQKNSSGNNNNSGCSEASTSCTAANSNRPRKRKRREMQSSDSELESELENCNLEDAIALEKQLRKVAKKNDLNDQEMRKLLQKFVRNEHVLALVTLKAEDELARERREAEQQRAIIITETPSVPKLTRAKARELNKTPGITLPSLNDTTPPEIAALIREDLHSDEDDEEYTFKDEDFVSDDDPNTTISDLDSNPCTPQTPLTQTEWEDSPVKLTADGCFKIPLDKSNQTQENMRIATRTRSKLCLQQTTIEDIQSEFVPPDVDINELHDMDAAANDEDWMQFLNEFSKPMNHSLLGDDDDPDNDPEYIAADKEPVDAEELRDVNISRKELTDLVSELLEGLVNEGVSLESIDLETPQKFVQSNNSFLETTPGKVDTPATTVAGPLNDAARYAEVTRKIDFNSNQMSSISAQEQPDACVSDATISSTNITQQECSFQPDVISTPTAVANRTSNALTTLVPIATNGTLSDDINCKTISISNAALASGSELIAIPVPGQPNQFQLARVLATHDKNEFSLSLSPEKTTNSIAKGWNSTDTRYTLPYDNNFTSDYISIKRHVYMEYLDKFESLRSAQPTLDNSTVTNNSQETNDEEGFTKYQHDLLQQQLRIHVQLVTQTFIQTYSHPVFWQMAPNMRNMLNELAQKAETHASYNAWNLKGAIDLVNRWEAELSEETPENSNLMSFMHSEIDSTNRNTRQVPRFWPRVMEFILNSNVFMYPAYLPRIPFTPKQNPFHIFAPSESLLIAIGLAKHMRRIKETGQRLSKKASPLVLACKYMSKDTIHGKEKRRIWDEVKKLRDASYYNPIKYYFEHDCAPPVQHELITFENNTVLPPIARFSELPLAWQHYLETKNKKGATKPKALSPKRHPTYLDLVRETVGEDVDLPETILETISPPINDRSTNSKRNNKAPQTPKKPSSVTINVNYIFGAGVDTSNLSLIGANGRTPLQARSNNVSVEYVDDDNDEHIPQVDAPAITPQSTDIVAYNYDCNLQRLEPVIVETPTAAKSNSAAVLEPSPEERVKVTAHNKSPRELPQTKVKHHNIWRRKPNRLSRSFLQKRRRRSGSLKCTKNLVKGYCAELFRNYRQYLARLELPYQSSPLVLKYFKKFKALELYTDFLDELKMFCCNAQTQPTNTGNNCIQSPTNTNKRQRTAMPLQTEEEANATIRNRKTSRQEENLRNMLQADCADDVNRKDATYALNFYEKVEEVFTAANRKEDYEKFNEILKSFDAKNDRVADLYHKMYALFQPDHPELAQAFLAFLLPSEAAEVGKFFEHFMITNMTTFINKLNIYFNKQPAQLRKIYNCLNELAEEPDVNIKRVEEKILPLLKGNQFLIDWFMQLFPEASVPARLLPETEQVNLKEVLSSHNNELMETMNDLSDVPADQQPTDCQLKYINGRIFYGTKITLPAKLSFMAKKFSAKDDSVTTPTDNSTSCVHGIREYGEKRLIAAAATTNANVLNNDDTTMDKSEEDELSKELIIDTTSITCEEDNSCQSPIETCDDATLRGHALRLNPSFYSNTCFTTAVTMTSTPNINSTTNQTTSSHQQYYSQAKKTTLNFSDDKKLSPRKDAMTTTVNSSLTNSPIILASSASNSPNALMTMTTGSNSQIQTIRERRRSPTKKIKSPNSATSGSPAASNVIKSRSYLQNTEQPMVVIPHDKHSAAIGYAKKLKSLIDSADGDDDNNEQTQQYEDQELHTPIIARVKQRSTNSLEIPTDDEIELAADFVPKLERSDELEFPPEHTPPVEYDNNSQTAFPSLQLEADSSIEECTSSTNVQDCNDVSRLTSPHNIRNNVDSDEDCKLDVVATLVSSSHGTEPVNNSTTKSNTLSSLPAASSSSSSSSDTIESSFPFTREEDKTILIEMKLGSRDRNDLYQRIQAKLASRTITDISQRHLFLMDFLSKLQGN